jgi:hypothetical protein
MYDNLIGAEINTGAVYLTPPNVMSITVCTLTVNPQTYIPMTGSIGVTFPKEYPPEKIPTSCIV